MKKVLIITYYWPPAGGPGVQRWLKFVKYLPEFNIKPIVYIPENPNYPMIDETLLSEVSNDLTILKQPISEPYKFANWLSKKNTKTISKGIIQKTKRQSFIEKLMLYIRGNFFIPDARKNWVKPSVKYLSKYIEDNNIKTIITTGPPHSLHLIGLQLKKRLDIKWISDFRDPWTTIGYHKKLKLSKASQKKHKELEASVLNNADHIVVTSYTTKKEFQSITAKPIAVITNGYDTKPLPNVTLNEKFTLAHIGSLLSERNPEILWQALSELISEHDDFAKTFQLNLIGAVSEDVLQSANQYNLSAYTNVMGYVSHDKAINYQNQSQVLLLIEIDSEDTKCIIPGKLFEYMAAKRPIIAIGPIGSDVNQILTETQAGHYFHYHEKEALKSLILNHFNNYKQGQLISSAQGLEKYSRKTLTQSLAEII